MWHIYFNYYTSEHRRLFPTSVKGKVKCLIVRRQDLHSYILNKLMVVQIGLEMEAILMLADRVRMCANQKSKKQEIYYSICHTITTGGGGGGGGGGDTLLYAQRSNI